MHAAEASLSQLLNLLIAYLLLRGFGIGRLLLGALGLLVRGRGRVRVGVGVRVRVRVKSRVKARVSVRVRGVVRV